MAMAGPSHHSHKPTRQEAIQHRPQSCARLKLKLGGQNHETGEEFQDFANCSHTFACFYQSLIGHSNNLLHVSHREHTQKVVKRRPLTSADITTLSKDIAYR